MAIIVGPTNWQFRANIPNLGSTFRGGNLICKSGGQVWIVAPQSTEVQNDWYTAAPGAVTNANSVAACGDWFIPTSTQLQNPGYVCRTYWENVCPTLYWSSTRTGFNQQQNTTVDFTTGNTVSCPNWCYAYRARAFRCVTY